MDCFATFLEVLWAGHGVAQTSASMGSRDHGATTTSTWTSRIGGSQWSKLHWEEKICSRKVFEGAFADTRPRQPFLDLELLWNSLKHRHPMILVERCGLSIMIIQNVCPDNTSNSCKTNQKWGYHMPSASRIMTKPLTPNNGVCVCHCFRLGSASN